jgi:hypothetical protein
MKSPTRRLTFREMVARDPELYPGCVTTSTASSTTTPERPTLGMKLRDLAQQCGSTYVPTVCLHIAWTLFPIAAYMGYSASVYVVACLAIESVRVQCSYYVPQYKNKQTLRVLAWHLASVMLIFRVVMSLDPTLWQNTHGSEDFVSGEFYKLAIVAAVTQFEQWIHTPSGEQ